MSVSLAVQNPSAPLSHDHSPIAVVDYGTSASDIERNLRGLGSQQSESQGRDTPRLDRLEELELDLPSPGDGGDSEYDEWAEDEANPVIEAFSGRGLPRIAERYRGRTEPSEITDVATQVGANRRRIRTESSLMSIPNSYDGSQGRLQSELFKALKKPPGERRRFLPSGELVRLVCEDAVVNELTKIEESFRRQVKIWKTSRTRQTIVDEARIICAVPPEDADVTQMPEPKSYKKIFAILLLIERPSKIRRFIREEVSDADLPLAKHFKEDKPKTFKLRRNNARDQPLRCFKKWKHSDVFRFEECQWSMLAPFFARSELRRVVHYRLNENIILPFVESEKVGMPGGFGQVYKTWINADHHEFTVSQSQNPKTYFAVKALHSGDKAAFKREVQILKRLSGTHKHLISLLATYEQHGKFYLIFHWAEADLLGYWKTVNPSPRMNSASIRWMARQCEGIARGLAKIHRYQTFSDTSLLSSKSTPGLASNSFPDAKFETPANGSPIKLLKAASEGAVRQPSHASSIRHLFGRHGDIKPENILWFPSARGGGTLKISDFGTAEFNEHENPPRSRKKGIANSPTYRPPECDLGDGCISPAYDIWTLGCLYLEFITWSLGGATYLDEFAERRFSKDPWFAHMLTDNFFTIDQDSETGKNTAIVKPSVTNFIRELHSHPKCTEFFHEFLDMIQTGMLVYQGSDCESTSSGRISCTRVFEQLGEMSSKCQSDPEYATGPAPWEDEMKSADA